MNKIKTCLIVLGVILTISLNQSCGSTPETLKDDQLSSFMLGGIYFFNGYGGIEPVKDMMSSANYVTDSELINGYKEILEFPFDQSQQSGIKRMFESMWDIKDKASLLASIEDLKTREHKYKAWDYARIVNNACMGYAAAYLTKEEVLEIAAETLPLAQQKYDTWDAYFTDFNLGRIDWNPNDEQGESFEFLAKNITKDEKSIYKILPLK